MGESVPVRYPKPFFKTGISGIQITTAMPVASSLRVMESLPGGLFWDNSTPAENRQQCPRGFVGRIQAEGRQKSQMKS